MNMSSVKYKSSNTKNFSQTETPYLNIDQIIFEKLSPRALKVYAQLRKKTAYKKISDSVFIPTKELAGLSQVSERQVYLVLNELEYVHHIIKRQCCNNGKTNPMQVSAKYNFFLETNDLEQKVVPFTPVDKCVQKMPATANIAVPTANIAVPTANIAYHKEQEFLQEVSKRKQNKGQNTVSVFFDYSSVKTHLEKVIADRNLFLEYDIIEQGIYYSFETNDNRSYMSVNKRINIFLMKVSRNQWNIPAGYKGITAQSIREDEEKAAEKKRESYQKDASAFKSMMNALSAGKRTIDSAQPTESPSTNEEKPKFSWCTMEEFKILSDYKHALKYKMVHIFFPSDEKLKKATEIHEREKNLILAHEKKLMEIADL